MSIPAAGRIRQNGVDYLDNLSRTEYLIAELSRSALRNVGKYIRDAAYEEILKLPEFESGNRTANPVQIWVEKGESVLVIGSKQEEGYGAAQEFGTSNQPKRAILQNAASRNIPEIRRILGSYLEAVADEDRALRLIDEDDEGGSVNESN